MILAIAGGSGSGKTTIARKLVAFLGSGRAQILSQDSYYKDQSAHFDRDGGSVNFDHPSALEFSLLRFHLEEFKKGNSIAVPIYDFATHKRSPKVQIVNPSEILIVDGILILGDSTMRELFDWKIFIDAPESVRFFRRLRRDVEERGRSEAGVREQFFAQVKPMHDQFVEPSKAYADLVCNGEDEVIRSVESIIAFCSLAQ